MGKTITVSTSTQLYDALKTASGGETILLQPGNYGTLWLSAGSGFDITFPSTVTITSADPAQQAVFSRLGLSGAANLAIKDVVFDYTYKPGDIDDYRPFEIAKSSNISITGSTFDGDVASGVSAAANGYGTGIGLSVRDSTDVTVAENEFFNWKRGIVVGNTSDIALTGNEVHDIRSDGMNFADVQGVRIEDNYIHDFRASYSAGDHRDMIQFWTTGTTQPSTDIVIRGNTLDIGEGSYTQSIFMRNEVVDSRQAGTEMYYRNILIEDNTIYNGHLHGITVGETDGLTIRNNSVLTVRDDDNPDQNGTTTWVPTIRVAPASTGVVIEANAVATITGPAGQSTWVVTNNALIQGGDPFKPGYYGDVFIGSTLDAEDGAHHYVALPGSLIETTGAGSAAIRPAAMMTSGDAVFTVAEDTVNGATRLFDAGLTATILGAADKGADYQWSFGDGTTASGKVVSHAFAAAGRYDVTLTVRLADGSLYTADADIAMQGSKLLSYNADKTAFEAYALGEASLLAPVARLDGTAIQTGGTGTALTVSRGALGDLRGSDDFAIDFTLKGDTAGGAGGELFRQHGTFIGTISSTGQMSFNMTTDDGKTTTLATTGLRLNDGQAHDISIRFKDGMLQIAADGEVNAEKAVSGVLVTASSADLVFGNPWGKPNYAGDISRFDISVDVGDYPEAPETTVLVPDTAAPVPPEPELPAATFASGMHDAGWTGQIIDIADMAGQKKILIGDAHVATADEAPAGSARAFAANDAVMGTEGAVLHLDGDKDYAKLGRQTAYEAADRLGFSVDFSRGVADGSTDRLIWNHLKVGLTLAGDGLVVHVATADDGFKGFGARNLGLNDTELHRAEVMIDTVDDRLQVVLDGEIVIDVDNADFEMEGAGGREAGWTIGTPWNRFFEGEVHDFRLGDRFDFLEDYVPAPTALLS